jgi:NADPH2:quinone reductase
MKATRVHQVGGPEVLKYEDVPDPSPGPGQALVDIQAVGVNYTDTYTRSGLYPSKLPLTLGVEGAGVVSAIGDGVTEVNVGETVCYNGTMGSYAERQVVDAWRLVKVPEGADAQMGATVLLQGLTAHYLVYSTYPLKAGESTLIHAGAGGVGLLLIQMAKHLGAYVFTTVSTEEKAALAKGAGADHVILYTRQDFEEEIKKATDGRGVQVAYDAVGKTTFEQSLRCLAPRGYLVLYGQSSGLVPPIFPSTLQTGSYFLTRPGLAHYTATRDDLLKRAGDVLGWAVSGQLKLRVDRTLPLSEAAEAHRALEGRQTAGKLLLVP